MIYRENKFNEERWSKLLGICVMDPDGWRNDNTPLEKKITLDDYFNRMTYSTIELKNWFLFTFIIESPLLTYFLKNSKRLTSINNDNNIIFSGRINGHSFKTEISYIDNKFNIVTILYIDRHSIIINNLETLIRYLKG